MNKKLLIFSILFCVVCERGSLWYVESKIKEMDKAHQIKMDSYNYLDQRNTISNNDLTRLAFVSDDIQKIITREINIYNAQFKKGRRK